MLKNSLFQPSLSFSFNVAPFFVSASVFLFASVSHLSSFFYFCFSATFFVSFQLLSFLFSSRVPFFQPKNTFFQPKTFLLQPKILFQFSPEKYYFQPKTFLLQPKILFQFSPKISPCLWFSSSFFLFLFFLPFFSAFSHYVLPFFSPSVQLKTFFSCFMSLYLSKSSFSSNLK